MNKELRTASDQQSQDKTPENPDKARWDRITHEVPPIGVGPKDN
jgi:hypothetical protein